jgi:integrase
MPAYYQIICDAALLSGLRPDCELQRFDPAWYSGSRRRISLPDGACLKDMCKFKNRQVILSLAGCDAMDKLVKTTVKFKRKDVPVLSRLPKRVAFRDALIRYAKSAGIGTEGITPKMFRKTLVSWLVACYPDKSLYIQASMGHDADTIVENYLGIGFTKDEIELIKTKYLNEWGSLV